VQVVCDEGLHHTPRQAPEYTLQTAQHHTACEHGSSQHSMTQHTTQACTLSATASPCLATSTKQQRELTLLKTKPHMLTSFHYKYNHSHIEIVNFSNSQDRVSQYHTCRTMIQLLGTLSVLHILDHVIDSLYSAPAANWLSRAFSNPAWQDTNRMCNSNSNRCGRHPAVGFA
jgi:hypothetical protein